MTQGLAHLGVGAGGGQGPQIRVCVGSRDRKGVGSKLSHSSLHLESGGALLCAPQLDPPTQAGSEGWQPLSALQRTLGSQAVLGSW